MSQKIKSHLGWAIVSFMMFWPTGVVALVKAIGANSAISRGDANAENMSTAAKKWCKITTIIWLVLVVLGVIGGIIGACVVSSASKGYYY